MGITLDVCQDFINTRQKSDQRKTLASHLLLSLWFVLSHLEKKIFFLQTLPLWTKNSTPFLEAWIQRPYVCGQRWRNNISRPTEGKLLSFNEKKNKSFIYQLLLNSWRFRTRNISRYFPSKSCPSLSENYRVSGWDFLSGGWLINFYCRTRLDKIYMSKIFLQLKQIEKKLRWCSLYQIGI